MKAIRADDERNARLPSLRSAIRTPHSHRPLAYSLTRPLTTGLLLACSLCLGGSALPSRAEAASQADEAFRTTASSLLEKYCFECHGELGAEASVNLQQLASEPDFIGRFKTWEKVLTMLREGKMPPEDMPQPESRERQILVRIISDCVDASIRAHAGDPGQVVMRRLTSAEYAYAIEDLTGLTLPLERLFVTDAVGGEGFTNVGGVQFIQDSTLERYLEAAKLVASHATIGSGPLAFYPDAGQTGLELSAIHRIQDIYRAYGFRTGAGEGAKPFGLDRYPKAFLAAWQYRYRDELARPPLSFPPQTGGLRGAATAGSPGGAVPAVTLAELAAKQGLRPNFVEHIWKVLTKPASSFPTSEIVAAWNALPAPSDDKPVTPEQAAEACDDLYALLRDWQSTLAATAGDEEEAPVLTEDSIEVAPAHSFQADLGWAPGSSRGFVELSVAPASANKQARSMVIWRNPRLRILGSEQPLRKLLSDETVRQLAFGRHPEGAEIGPNDFVLAAGTTMPIEFRVPEDSKGSRMSVDVELDLEHGEPGVVRCTIDDKMQGATAAETGALSALLADPKGKHFDDWLRGVLEFARDLPEVSHREPAPSDRDPIPAPFDNTYNSRERNLFHYVIKYHRDDDFLVRYLLDDPARRHLDQAWVDLLTSFEYYDAYLREVTEKFGLEFHGRGIADLDPQQVEAMPAEPREFVRRLRDEYVAAQAARMAAEPGHVEDAIRLAERAWRRPLSDDEKDRLRAFYAELRGRGQLDHTQAMRALLARIFVAPAFLYRVEGPPNEPGIMPLTDWELASRLSFFLWSSIPDAELRRAAEAGELTDPDELARQARRMLADPKARRFATEFFGQWFGFYRFDQYHGVDARRFPEFTDSLKAAMYDEAVSFFEHIVRDDRPVDEILFADYAYLNRQLAQHYAIETETPLTDEVTRVPGAGKFRRGGLLRMGAVLTATSAPLRTSAVKRGNWILRRVLGTPVPPPPPDAGSIAAADVLPDGLTVRQRLEAHRREASCVNCHARFDPLGFALEHFDVIGRWRDQYRDGQPIDASGVLLDGTEIAGLDGLRQYLIEQKPQFHRTLCAKLLGYALGRSEIAPDRVLIDEMQADLKEDGRFSNLVVKMVTSPQFRHQRGGD